MDSTDAFGAFLRETFYLGLAGILAPPVPSATDDAPSLSLFLESHSRQVASLIRLAGSDLTGASQPIIDQAVSQAVWVDVVNADLEGAWIDASPEPRRRAVAFVHFGREGDEYRAAVRGCDAAPGEGAHPCEILGNLVASYEVPRPSREDVEMGFTAIRLSP
ncbi:MULTISPECIES: hypothetical protein [unclassified Thioalkalivibrio]|uniref:hypothetical protein n=1 Tax=unclassified Thioalkalivibrio TaxID=2621013 RepID=UPI001E4C4E2C|nr:MULTISPECIES: hypothetical protein [unclassified Thioalkalivibrio]